MIGYPYLFPLACTACPSIGNVVGSLSFSPLGCKTIREVKLLALHTPGIGDVY